MLRLGSSWVWDFWLADDGDLFHQFFLKAPRAHGDPDERHRHATVGHAVSRDLTDWVEVADALTPSPGPAFDDLAIWTGSVVRDGTGWRMFYTGIDRADRGRVQRIGAAVSGDLLTWTRVSSEPSPPGSASTHGSRQNSSPAVAVAYHRRSATSDGSDDTRVHVRRSPETAAPIRCTRPRSARSMPV